MASKAVVRRQKQASILRTAMRFYGQRVGRAFHRRLEGGGTASSPGTTKGLLELCLASVEEARDTLVDADEALLGLRADLGGFRRCRDERARELYGRLCDLRKIVEAVYGAGASKEVLALTGKTSRDPVVLLRQARRAVSLCRNPRATLPAKRFAAVSLSLEQCAAELQPAVEALATALAAVRSGERAEDDALLHKRKALAEFDRRYADCNRIFESVLRFAEMDRVAAHVRNARRARRRGRSRRGRSRQTSADGARTRPRSPAVGEPIRFGAAPDPPFAAVAPI